MGRWLDALKKHENAPDGNPQKYQKSDLANFDTFETAGFADLQKNSGTVSNDQRPTLEGENREEPLSFSHPTQENDRRRVIPFPGREWKPDTKIRPDDPERYADALRVHGPASYGMMMRILGWGGTRAGRAEDELQKQGRIAFDKCGFAVLIDQKGKTHD